VMEFLEGSSLKEYAQKNGKFPAQKFLEQIRPLMEDVQKMHDRGVIHRDIAPDNIILQPDGQLKLIDFGAARSYIGDKSMTVVVKKGFAPLEQYMSKGSTAATDVYALAATIYYCTTGTVPPDSAERQCDDTPLQSPISLGAEISEAQEKALFKALEIQQKARTQTVREFLDQLQAVQEPEPEPEPESKPVFIPEEPITPKDEPHKDPETTRPRHSWTEKLKAIPWNKLLAGIAAGVLVITLIVYLAGANQRKYDLACSYFEQKQYEQAAELFSELGDYEDSSSKQKAAQYAWAEQLVDETQFEQASELFGQLGDYKDSAAKRKQTIYSWGEYLLKNKVYDRAAILFADLGNYKDSSTKRQEALYLKAEEMVDNKQFDDALRTLKEIPRYKNTQFLTNKIHYQKAQLYLEDNEYADAYTELAAIVGYYQDADSTLQNLVQKWAKEIIDDSRLSDAKEYVKTVRLNPKDSNYLYDLIVNKEYYSGNGISSSENDFPTRAVMLDALEGYFPLKEDLRTLFGKFNGRSSITFIHENRTLIEKLWDAPIMRDILEADYNLTTWLLGKWKANNGYYIEFYEEPDQYSIWCGSNLPGTWYADATYYRIVDMEYVLFDEAGNEVGKQFRFELLTPDTMNVYCYKNEKTYLMKRSQ